MSSPTKADLAAAVAQLTKENKGLRDLLAAVSAVADTVPVAAAGVPDWRELRRSTHVLSAVKVVANPAGSWAWGHATGHAAKHLREIAAEPAGYEVYAEPEPVADAAPAPASPATLVVSTRPEAAAARLCAKGGHMVGVYCKLPPHSEGDHLGTGPDGDVTWPQLRPANPPYHMTPGTIGPCCLAEDGGFICNAQEDHDGPDHVAYGSEGEQCHRWPVASGTPVAAGDEGAPADPCPACLHPACACAAFRLAPATVSA